MTDKDRIDFLEKVHAENKYSDIVTMRKSITGRGWRLHSTSDAECLGGISCKSVREAIDSFAKEAK